jgi:RNA polymerase sigma-70 factor (ECF subfamily)
VALRRPLRPLSRAPVNRSFNAEDKPGSPTSVPPERWGSVLGMDDDALVARTLAGELDAFAVLVERHRESVFRLAARLVGPDEAGDVAQDAFLRAFHKLSSFRRESSFRAWLMRIAHNAAVNALARRRPVPIGELPEPDPAESPGKASSSAPAAHLEERERRERLALKLRALPPAHRAVLVLRDLEGLSYEEIAQITEAPLGSVKGRLHRARQELIELLRNNTYDWELPR